MKYTIQRSEFGVRYRQHEKSGIHQNLLNLCIDKRAHYTTSGQLGKNAIQLKKHLYDYLVYDSKTERDFAAELDACEDVAVYVKLPKSFSINTPVGNYSPDWAIAFNQGKVKHIYFVAETKGDLSTLQFREVESLKIHCAREHFKAISSDNVKYDVVHTYSELLNVVMK